MEAIITRGGRELSLVYGPSQLKDLVTGLAVVLMGRDPFISPNGAIEKLNGIKEMIDELLTDMKGGDLLRKEWVLIKRRITNHIKGLSKMHRGDPIQTFIWDFIAAMDGVGNLNGFGFCAMPFKDPLRGDAERVSLYELKKTDI